MLQIRRGIVIQSVYLYIICLYTSKTRCLQIFTAPFLPYILREEGWLQQPHILCLLWISLMKWLFFPLKKLGFSFATCTYIMIQFMQWLDTDNILFLTTIITIGGYNKNSRQNRREDTWEWKAVGYFLQQPLLIIWNNTYFVLL